MKRVKTARCMRFDLVKNRDSSGKNQEKPGLGGG